MDRWWIGSMIRIILYFFCECWKGMAWRITIGLEGAAWISILDRGGGFWKGSSILGMWFGLNQLGMNLIHSHIEFNWTIVIVAFLNFNPFYNQIN